MREIAYSPKIKNLMKKKDNRRKIEIAIIEFSIGNWGEISDTGKEYNIASTIHHRKVYGIYKFKNGKEFWIVKGAVEPDMLLVLTPSEAYAYNAELPSMYKDKVEVCNG